MPSRRIYWQTRKYSSYAPARSFLSEADLSSSPGSNAEHAKYHQDVGGYTGKDRAGSALSA